MISLKIKYIEIFLIQEIWFKFILNVIIFVI